MLLSRALAATLCQEFRANGQRIVFTNGCFDIVHIGHTRYLQAARNLGDVLFVGVNSDASVKRLKGASRPVNAELDRAELLSALCSVDYTCIFEEDTPFDLIQALQPDILVKGGDYTPETIIGADIVLARGGRVEVIPFVEGRSTTRILERLSS
jgi:D-beta-D-heptose 7-phosphate kinase/D-beta-D-heptose 1-phosphate adenosyltransferase